MKAVIVYASTHHGNTKKVVEQMAEILSADLIDITKNQKPNISSYDIVGLASGVYFHSFDEKLKAFISNNNFQRHQKVFLVATCGVRYMDYTKKIKKILKEKQIECLGSFQCRGYDTYGILAKLGGIAKQHPSAKDLKKAKDFVRKIKSKSLYN